MRHSLIPALLAATLNLPAAVVQGLVLEQLSGRPLARAIVRLEPVPGSSDSSGPVKPQTTRSGRSGHFVFNHVQPGVYHLVATSDGYFPAAHFQRRPTGYGAPIRIATDSDFFTELRMHHKGAITGRVLDENGVGTPGVSVLAYRARLPLQSAGRATSDDRGVYRIAWLDPGKYWVRSAAVTLSDGSGWLPTFGPQSRESRDARVFPVTPDTDTTDADISPEDGRLFHLSGMIQCDTLAPVNVVLSSETGRRSMGSGCNLAYRFEGLAPGVYELFAKTTDGGSSGFTELFLDRDNESGNVIVLKLPQATIEVQRGTSVSQRDSSVKLTGRRRDLSESEMEKEIPLPYPQLDPGHWELHGHAAAGQYVESIVEMYSPPRRAFSGPPATDWFEAFIQQRYPSRIRIKVSDRAARINGIVKSEGQPAPGVPVFLWPSDDSARRSLGGALQTMTDADGHFSFHSLPPGDYRALATLDVSEVDAELMAISNAASIHAEAGQAANADLAVWLAP
jgi:5-hydroxyisourate hydrolase-like protein (transthyretin family)